MPASRPVAANLTIRVALSLTAKLPQPPHSALRVRAHTLLSPPAQARIALRLAAATVVITEAAPTKKVAMTKQKTS